MPKLRVEVNEHEHVSMFLDDVRIDGAEQSFSLRKDGDAHLTVNFRDLTDKDSLARHKPEDLARWQKQQDEMVVQLRKIPYVKLFKITVME